MRSYTKQLKNHTLAVVEGEHHAHMDCAPEVAAAAARWLMLDEPWTLASTQQAAANPIRSKL
jgi:hypothetical protein